jgi:hypothetical protein
MNMAAERCSNTWIYSITLHGVVLVQDAARNTNRGRLSFGVPLYTPRSVLTERGTISEIPYLKVTRPSITSKKHGCVQRGDIHSENNMQVQM